jgi:hypothetical protein
MIEVIELDGHALSMLGDNYEALVYFKEKEDALIPRIEEALHEKCEIQVLKGQKKEKRFIRIKTYSPLDKKQIAAMSLGDETVAIKILPPVLPILTTKEIEVPFGTCEQMLAYNRSRQLNLAELIAVAGASMALQNSLGMICDPVANRVEVPCLGKNVMAASNAVSCTNMALAGYDPVIPLDEIIRTMDDVGKSIPSKLRCTALGGLSVTETSKKIKGKLAGLQ